MQDFNFHQHTYRCGHADNNYSDEDYIIESINNNLKAICFTEHGPNSIDKRKNVRLDYIDRYDYLNKISLLKELYQGIIDIYKGYEIEYSEKNKQELKRLRSESDLLLLGQHFIENDNQIIYNNFSDDNLEKYTETIEQGLSTGYFDILAHPDYAFRNSFGEKEEDMTRRICTACYKNDVALEINLNRIFAKTYFDYKRKKIKSYKKLEKHYHKLEGIEYPNKNFFEIVKEYDVKVLYGIDTHFKGQISLFNDMINIANQKIGQDIVNDLEFCSKENIINKAKTRKR